MNGSTLTRKTPMRRTGIKAKTPAAGAGLLRTAAIQRSRKPMKASRPKKTKIRSAAKGQDCTLMIPGVCNRDPATTVLCHSNRLADGKGIGIKAPDTEACFGCSDCHDVLDGRRPLPGWMTREKLDSTFDRARAITQEKLKEKGLIA
jgi:hypothetical protein